MKNTTRLVIFYTLIILWCFLAIGINGSKQGEALGRWYRKKPKSDINHFNVEEDVFGEEGADGEQEQQKERDRIERLPGQPDGLNLSHYGGYVTVNQKAGRALYYYFVEARTSPETRPLLLWLNGGPGCSSLGYGAMQELGPLSVYSDGQTLFENKFSWDHAANVLFLESPAGVGFSYSNTTSDMEIGGDNTTAIDNYVFLSKWLERFPEYKTRPFYITGESYAGHYVPELANTILTYNQKAQNTFINLKGIMIGNAVINYETDSEGMYEYFASHALISEDTEYQINNYCDFSPNVNFSNECLKVLEIAEKPFDEINIYNIYAPLCFNSNLTNKPTKSKGLSIDPCIDYYVIAYLNRPEVQKAIHANITQLSYPWSPCSIPMKEWVDSPSTVLPLITKFMENGLRVWVYSGDVDGRVPVTSTIKSLKEMKRGIITSWHPWYLSGEVAGYAQVYEGNVTFTTIRGAGHEVPSYKPAAALSLVSHFLQGTTLPPV